MSDVRPSVTAVLVASTLLLLRDDDELGHLVDRECLAPIEAAVRTTLPFLGHALDVVPWPALRSVARGIERIVSPGFVAHYALRKHTIRGYLAQAVSEGFEQVVLVGAGFDMMSDSLPESVRVFEVDHPATQRAKRASLPSTPQGRVTFVPVDLRRARLAHALRDAAEFDPRRGTVFVAEGVLMYLEREVAEGVMADMASPGRRTRAIVTIVTPDERGRPRLHSQRSVVDHCMTLLDERFLWGEARERVGAVLARQGLRVDAIVSTNEVRDRTLPRKARRHLPRPTGELIVVASASGATDDLESCTRATGAWGSSGRRT